MRNNNKQAKRIHFLLYITKQKQRTKASEAFLTTTEKEQKSKH